MPHPGSHQAIGALFAAARTAVKPFALGIAPDRTGLRPIVPGLHGHLEFDAEGRFVVVTDRLWLRQPLLMVPGIIRTGSDADDDPDIFRAIVPREAVQQVADIIKANRSRPASCRLGPGI